MQNSVRNWLVSQLLLLIVALGYMAPEALASEGKYQFDIPENDAARSLQLLAQQSNTPLLFSHSDINGLQGNTVKGYFSIREALAILLKGSRFSGKFNQNGVLTIVEVETQEGDTGMKLQKKPLAALVAILAGATSVATVAEEQPKDDITEEIIVKGIRGSLAKALSIKENSTGFVDAISAEDVGKLPDQNVAEALQRVTGVAIQRSRGEGDFVSIRGLGPDFVRGTVNGRSLLNATETVDPIFNGNLVTSTGRAANFDILPSEIINTLEVVKSTSAKHIEGGIGGSVNLKTARPLTMGDKTAFSVTANYRDFNEETDPSFSGLHSWVNDDETFGILTAISYSERSIREDFSRTFGYFPSFGLSTQLDTDDNGFGDASPNDVPFPLSNNAEAFEEDRDRFTFMNTLQWSNEDSELTVDLLYSKREVEESHQNFIFLPIAFDSDLAGRTVNPDGSVQVGDLVTGGVFSEIPSTLRPELTTDLQDYEDDLLNIGVNYAWKSGVWDLSADVNYSKAEGENVFNRVRIDGDNGDFAFNTIISDSGFNITQTNIGGNADTQLGNPANFIISVIDDRFASNEDEEFAFQFDASREIESSFLSSIEMGARVRTREKTIDRGGSGNGFGVTAANVAASAATTNAAASNFLDGAYQTNFGFESLVFPNNALAIDAIRAQLPTLLTELGTLQAIAEGSRTDDQNARIAGILAVQSALSPIPANPFSSFSIEEDTYAGYVQLNMDGQIGGINYIGDVGFRIVLTEQTISGFDAEFVITDTGGQDTTSFDLLTTGAATPVTFESNYANVLPSVNFSFELSEGLYLRMAANQSLTRPTFNSLAPAFSINANSSTNLNNDNFAVSLGAGNPALEPFVATNFDLGIEWYFAEASALYAGLFHKEIEDFVATVTNNNVSELAGEPIRAIGVEMNGSRGAIAIDQVSQPDNQGEAQITGLELGYQHTFESGFGYIANLTLIENSLEFEATGVDIPFPGVSDVSYNLTAFYENGPFSARLSYTDRSEYLVESSAIGFGGQLFNDDYSQLDGSLSYELNDNFTLFLNAVNLTDEDQDVFQVLPNIDGRRYSSTSHVGTRFAFGVRGSF